ncbi:response regulator NasT [Rubricella aquisinus]|uniref:Response regulator NasT n=1 Tax=Rubricella aquisinus TaxID=2028108 RepID=A0A840WIZ9_9RHOB|nr:ANTAR domain-containing protein [Rubricella aquisinus]MBB5514183.1 response regulator NasT [Rubricella aquisinus]
MFEAPQLVNTLKILVIDLNTDRGEEIVAALSQDDTVTVVLRRGAGGLVRDLEEIAPDLVLIDMEHPNRDTIDALTVATAPLDRPVAMFVDRSGKALMQAAVAAGVSAYVVDGLRAERVRPVLDMAIARFHEVDRLRKELRATQTALSERKTIDRAKGLLMSARGLSEEEAYALLRKTAMDKGKRVSDVAEALISAAELLQ